MMFGLSMLTRRSSGGGGAAPPLTPAYILLDNFGSLTVPSTRTFAPAGNTGSIVAGAVRMAPLLLSNPNTTIPQVGVGTPNLQTPLTDWPAGSLIGVLVHPSSGPVCATTGINVGFTIPGTGGIEFVNRSEATPLANQTFQAPSMWGDGWPVWLFYGASEIRQTSYAGPKLSDVNTGAAKSVRITALNSTTIRTGAPISIDTMVVVTEPLMSQVSLSLDDTTAEMRTVLAGIIETINNTRGFTGAQRIRPTAYIMKDAVGPIISEAQLKELVTLYQWELGVDSGVTAGGEPSTRYPTVAAAIAAMDANRDFLLGLNVGLTMERVSDTVFSFGNYAYRNTVSSAPTTADSITVAATSGPQTTLTLTVGNAFGLNALCAGVRLKNASNLLGIRVSEAPSATSIIVDTPVNLGAATAFDLCALAPGVAVTATDGTITVTGVNTRFLVPGMSVSGLGIPSGRTIATIPVESTGGLSNGTITTNIALPAGLTILNFGFYDEEWAQGKMIDAMIAHSPPYRSARNATASAAIGGQFGVDIRRRMMLANFSIDVLDVADAMPTVDFCIRNGLDLSIFLHARNNTDYTRLTRVLNALADRIEFGLSSDPAIRRTGCVVRPINEVCAEWDRRVFA